MNWKISPLFALLAGVLFSSCSGGKDDHVLVVGMELKYPPFEMTEVSGAPTGVSVDLAQALGDYLHRPVRIENMPFDGLIPSLKTGKIDLIISSMTATPERAKSLAFSEPYLTTGLALLVGKDSPVHTVGDLDQAGRTVAVKQGTTGQLYADEHLKNARVMVLAEETACVLEVAQGKADAFIYDQMSVFNNAKKYPDQTRPILTPFRQESWAVGLRQGDDDLQVKVNAFIAEFRAKGGFKRLAEKYLSEEKAAFERQGLPFVF